MGARVAQSKKTVHIWTVVGCTLLLAILLPNTPAWVWLLVGFVLIVYIIYISRESQGSSGTVGPALNDNFAEQTRSNPTHLNLVDNSFIIDSTKPIPTIIASLGLAKANDVAAPVVAREAGTTTAETPCADVEAHIQLLAESNKNDSSAENCVENLQTAEPCQGKSTFRVSDDHSQVEEIKVPDVIVARADAFPEMKGESSCSATSPALVFLKFCHTEHLAVDHLPSVVASELTKAFALVKEKILIDMPGVPYRITPWFGKANGQLFMQELIKYGITGFVEQDTFSLKWNMQLVTPVEREVVRLHVLAYREKQHRRTEVYPARPQTLSPTELVPGAQRNSEPVVNKPAPPNVPDEIVARADASPEMEGESSCSAASPALVQDLKLDEPYFVLDSRTDEPVYLIPVEPKALKSDSRWIPVDEQIEVAGYLITGGLIYVGSNLRAVNGELDPSLVNERKPVSSKKGNFTENLPNYWPSYSEISPEARSAYLRWLTEGRNHPQAAIGYVFLYFYGLERRVLVDVENDVTAARDKPAIIDELRRLLRIYGTQSGSFRNYASRLLELLEFSLLPDKLYEKPLPVLENSFDLPLYLRVALGQAVADGAPITSDIALAWIEHAPWAIRRTPITRCRAEFHKLFKIKYVQQFGLGMRIEANRTKLKVVYRPASAGFRGASDITLTLGELPDVTALSTPINKLQAIVDACSEDLDAFSRFVGRYPDRGTSLGALIQLPIALWSESAVISLNRIKERVGNGMLVSTFNELAEMFGAPNEITRESMQGVARALIRQQILIEPDILGGARLPDQAEKVVFFYGELVAIEESATRAYQVALVSIELAAGVAASDGEFSTSELMYLNGHIDSWLHLPVIHRNRLKARTRLLMFSQVPLGTLRKKIELLDSDSRNSMATFCAALVHADGTVHPEEVKFLEKIYNLLGVEQQQVYSDVHKLVSEPITKDARRTVLASGITLDKRKIEALQRDSEKVSAMLADIFMEVAQPESESNVTEEVEMATGVLGLDKNYSAFARVLMSRPEWTRKELTDVAQDLDLMLDGALERVNEAAFDALNTAFTYGEDPIEINPEIFESITP